MLNIINIMVIIVLSFAGFGIIDMVVESGKGK